MWALVQPSAGDLTCGSGSELRGGNCDTAFLKKREPGGVGRLHAGWQDAGGRGLRVGLSAPDEAVHRFKSAARCAARCCARSHRLAATSVRRLPRRCAGCAAAAGGWVGGR